MDTATLPPPAEAGQEQKPLLQWAEHRDRDEWSAPNTAGISPACPSDYVAGAAAEFIIELLDGAYEAAGSDDALLENDPGPFSTFEAAQKWCEERNAALLAAKDQPAAEAQDDSPTEDKPGSRDLPPIDYHKAYDEIDALEHDVAEAEKDWEEAKSLAKTAKDHFDYKVNELREAVRKYRPGQAPLFEQKHAPDAGKPAENMTENMTGADDDAWRAVTLEALGIDKPRIVKALAEHEPPLTTLGALADWTAEKGQWWAKDISGVGDKAAEEITEALDAYWQANPLPTKDEKPADPKPEEANGQFAEDDARYAAKEAEKNGQPEPVAVGAEPEREPGLVRIDEAIAAGRKKGKRRR